MGCIHLSYDDFCRLTPVEVEHIYKEYREEQDSDYKDQWGRIRMLATIMIQPHLKKKITPQKLLPFPWESDTNGLQKKEATITPAQSMKRFEELAKRVEVKFTRC